MRQFPLLMICMCLLAYPAFGDEDIAVLNATKFSGGKWTGGIEIDLGLKYDVLERRAKRRKERVSAWSHKFRIINDARSPVRITHAELHNIGKPFFGSDYKIPAYIVRITSTGQNVSTVLYGVLRYDSFRDYDGGNSLISTTFEKNVEGEWRFYQELSPAFKRFGTGCIFVRKVRLGDGSIWEMNTEHIANEMINAKCGAKNLKEQEKHIKEKGKPTLRL